MRTIALSVGLLAGAALATGSNSPSHGGAYRGPGTGIGPGGSAPGSGAPGAGASGAAEWSSWWSFNRDAYLALKDALSLQGAATPGEEAYLGEGQALGPSADGRPGASELARRVVPALLRVFEERDDPDLVTGCLLALAKIGVEADDGSLPRLEPHFASFLGSRNQEVAETAAVALGVLGRDSAVPLLAALLADSAAGREHTGRRAVPERTRAFSAYGLGVSAGRSSNEDARRLAVLHLSRTVEAGSASRDLPSAALLAVGIVPLPSSDAWETPEGNTAADPPTRSREAQIAWLLGWMERGDAPVAVRAHAPVALARLVDGASPGAREAAARALLGLLAEHAGTSQDLRRAATGALGAIVGDGGDPLGAEIRTALVRVAGDGDALVRGLARISLARAGARSGGAAEPGIGVSQARAFLLRDLARGRGSSRSWTALALGVMEHGRLAAGAAPSADVRAALRAALRAHGSPADAGALATALGLCRDLEAAPLVLELLNGGGPEGVRAFAAVALGLMGAREAIPDLRRIAAGSTALPGLQREAAIALGLLGDREVALDLARALGEARTLAAKSSLATALGTIGDARAIDPLLAILSDPRAGSQTRAFAAVALGILCDKERLPWNSRLAADVYYGLPPATLTDPLGARGVLDML